MSELKYMENKENAYVLLSGGQDSTTCLFWAKQNFKEIEAIYIEYGQHNPLEVEAAHTVAAMAGIGLKKFEFDFVKQLDWNHFENMQTLPLYPPDFIPARNDFLLSIAAAYAFRQKRLGTIHLVIGAFDNENGYPDCRQAYLNAKAVSMGLALDKNVYIHSPLLFLYKWEALKMAEDLPGCWDALSFTHSCSHKVKGGCGKCDSCILRGDGFKHIGQIDPMKMRIAGF